MTEQTFRKSTAREYFESLTITVILALFGTTFIVHLNVAGKATTIAISAGGSLYRAG